MLIRSRPRAVGSATKSCPFLRGLSAAEIIGYLAEKVEKLAEKINAFRFPSCKRVTLELFHSSIGLDFEGGGLYLIRVLQRQTHTQELEMAAPCSLSIRVRLVGRGICERTEINCT